MLTVSRMLYSKKKTVTDRAVNDTVTLEALVAASRMSGRLSAANLPNSAVGVIFKTGYLKPWYL